MSVVLQLVDFTASGVLGSAWTATGGTFIQDGQRARMTAVATYSRAVLNAVPPLSASNPIRGRYEVDLQLPPSFPTTGIVRGGVVFAGGYGHLVWHRSSGGGSTIFDFFARHGTTGAETSFYSTTVALAADTTVRIRANVSYSSGALVVEAWYSTTAGASWSYLFLSTPSTAVWNTATGQALANMTASARTGGIVGNMAGVPGAVPPGPGSVAPSVFGGGYFDNYRVTDIGNLALSPAFTTAPALTAAPSLTPITVGTEDDSTVATLPIAPDWPAIPTDAYRVTEHAYDGGYTVPVANQTAPRRSWPFRWSNIPLANVDTLVTFRDSVAQSSAWSFVDPETGATLRLVFTTDMTITRVGPDAYDCAADVMEVLNA